MPTRLLVADHQEVMRRGLRSMIARSDVEVVAEASDDAEALRLVGTHHPDVVILDVRFAGNDGFETLERLKEKWPDLPVLMWSTSDNPTYIARAMALAADGYLPRSVNRRELLATILTVAEDRQAWSETQLQAFKGAAKTPRGLKVDLTPREREVLRQLAHGLSNKEIGRVLGISYETVKEHVQHILRKLDVSDRTQAAVWSVREGYE